MASFPKIAAMHIFWHKKKTLSHVFISPQDILWSSDDDDSVCVYVCACVGGYGSGRKNLHKSACCSNRVMGLPDWDVSHEHTQCINVDVVDIVIVSPR